MEVLNNDRKVLAQCTSWESKAAACRLLVGSSLIIPPRYGVEKEALTGNYIVTISR